MCIADRVTVFEREVSSSLGSRLGAQEGDQVEDTKRTPAQNDPSTTGHVRQLLYSDNNKQQRVILCKQIN